MQADIDQLMQGELGEWLSNQASMREEARAKAWNHGLYGGGAWVILIGLIWFVLDWSGPFSFFVGAVALMALATFVYWPIASATKEIKVGINSAIARSLGIEYQHDVTPGEEFANARKYGLLPSYERRATEDHWFGEMEGHAFGLYEAHLEVERGSDKNRRWVTVFRGALISMEFGRDFRSTILLQRAGKHRQMDGPWGHKRHCQFQRARIGSGRSSPPRL